jgi:hypothetical protein
VGQQTTDPSESFQPVWNSATKTAAGGAAKSTSAKDNTSDPGVSENSKSAPNGKNAKGPEPAAKKSDAAPVVIAADPLPQPAALLKAPEVPVEQARPVSQPAPATEQAAFTEIFAPPPPVLPTPSNTTPPAVNPPLDPGQNDSTAPVDPGTLVFQLSLNPVEPAKAQTAPATAENKAETLAFFAEEEVSDVPQTHAGESGSDAKNQDQQQQSTPQPLPAGTDGTVASQFGFQNPMSFAVHIAAPKPEVTAPARPIENVSTPDLPVASTVDRISLTIRGADDQVVRVAINQSGGMVQVGVNTANSDLANQLRISVPELVHHLDQQGYESKVSMPSSPSPSASVPVSIASAHSEFRSGADTNGNTKSNSDLTSQNEPRQQRQRQPQRAWRELASQLQDD